MADTTSPASGKAPQDERPGSQDSPKRQGDPFAGATGAASPVAPSEDPIPGDSPKRQGDPLAHTLKDASGG